MTTKKPTDPTKATTGLKSVSLGQINKLEGKTVVGGAAPVESASTQSKVNRDLKKIDKTIEKIDRNPTPQGGSSSGSDSKSMEKDVDKRIGDGLPPYPPR